MIHWNISPMSTQTAKPVAQKTMSSAPTDNGGKIELVVAIALSVWAVVLHVIFMQHGGPLWRDEVNSIAFANMPSWGKIWHDLQYDNFPPLFIAVVRTWSSLGFTSDLSYRVLGCLIGVFSVGVFWATARMMGARTPLLILALYGVNPLAIRVGDSMRAYGLGIAFTMLTMAALWRLINEAADGKRRNTWFAVATISAVLSVQTLYQCALFVAVFCCAGWVFTLRRRDWKTSMRVGNRRFNCSAVVTAIDPDLSQRTTGLRDRTHGRYDRRRVAGFDESVECDWTVGCVGLVCGHFRKRDRRVEETNHDANVCHACDVVQRNRLSRFHFGQRLSSAAALLSDF
jgi:hypothetical protein